MHRTDNTETEYDRELFEKLVDNARVGGVTDETRHGLNYPRPEDLLTCLDGEPHQTAGNALISSGAVGSVIMAGGLASRFGGSPKAAFELVPGWSLIRIKLELLQTCAQALNTEIAVIVTVSFATERVLEAVLNSLHFPNLQVHLVRQSALPQLDEHWQMVREATGEPKLCPSGHGSLLTAISAALNKTPHLKRAMWHISNIDNLVATLDPALVGMHAASQADATVEVTEGATSDTGGFLVQKADRLEIVEGFRVAEEERPTRAFAFSTNTFIIEEAALDRASQLPFHLVRKTLSDGQQVSQFEQLLGDMGQLIRLNAILVPRHGSNTRFIPLKQVEDLNRSRDNLISILEQKGLSLR